ncbi:MAG TPA: hypothetical protein VGC66_18620 [Pyrinomonadaceae bacterium]|jgi:hypothetical protein
MPEEQTNSTIVPFSLGQTQFSTIGGIPGFLKGTLFVGCWQEDFVVPGQPFSFSWQLWSYNLPLNLGNVFGQLFLNNKLVYTTKTVPFVTRQQNSETKLQYEMNVVPPSDNALLSDLYKLGTQSLEFKITADGPDKNKLPMFTKLDMEIIPEPTGERWFEPKGASKDMVNFYLTLHVDFGEKYIVQAVFRNQSKTLKMRCEMRTRTVEGNNSSFTQPADSGFILPGKAIGFRYGPISQKWLWTAPVSFIPFGPFNKTFRYTEVYRLEDELGNKYPDEWESAVAALVTVTVQPWKIALAVTAAGLLILAAMFMSTGFWPLVLAGMAMMLVAVGLYLAAQDPPEPNPHYLEPVEIVPPALPQILMEEKEAAPFVPLLEIINSMLGAHDALSEIHSRLLGARQDNNEEGERLQVKGYRATLRYLKRSASQLNDAAASIMQVDNKAIFDADQISSTLDNWRREGLPPYVIELCTKAGLQNEVIQNLEAAIRERDFIEHAQAGLAPNLALAVVSLTRFATGIQRAAPKILRKRRDRRTSLDEESMSILQEPEVSSPPE